MHAQSHSRSNPRHVAAPVDRPASVPIDDAEYTNSQSPSHSIPRRRLRRQMAHQRVSSPSASRGMQKKTRSHFLASLKSLLFRSSSSADYDDESVDADDIFEDSSECSSPSRSRSPSQKHSPPSAVRRIARKITRVSETSDATYSGVEDHSDADRDDDVYDMPDSHHSHRGAKSAPNTGKLSTRALCNSSSEAAIHAARMRGAAPIASAAASRARGLARGLSALALTAKSLTPPMRSRHLSADPSRSAARPPLDALGATPVPAPVSVRAPLSSPTAAASRSQSMAVDASYGAAMHVDETGSTTRHAVDMTSSTGFGRCDHVDGNNSNTGNECEDDEAKQQLLFSPVYMRHPHHLSAEDVQHMHDNPHAYAHVLAAMHSLSSHGHEQKSAPSFSASSNVHPSPHSFGSAVSASEAPMPSASTRESPNSVSSEDSTIDDSSFITSVSLNRAASFKHEASLNYGTSSVRAAPPSAMVTTPALTPASSASSSSSSSSASLASSHTAQEDTEVHDQNQVQSTNEAQQTECAEDEFDPFVFIKNMNKISPLSGISEYHIAPKPQDAPKVSLVLDLDETLVHCSIQPIPDSDIVFGVNFNGVDYAVHVRTRPHLRTFLQKVSEWFEVILFTASQQVYADKLLDILDPEHKYIHHRAFRGSCVCVDGNYLKDLNVLGRKLDRVAIVDNSPQAFGFQINNGIPIESWFDDNNDRELLKLLPFLQVLRHANDVRPLIKQQFRLQEYIDSL
jgi:Dullard-like phosphatase family protein